MYSYELLLVMSVIINKQLKWYFHRDFPPDMKTVYTLLHILLASGGVVSKSLCGVVAMQACKRRSKQAHQAVRQINIRGLTS